MNTLQAILITNGSASYSVFTYQCGSLGWSRHTTVIGYNAAGKVFENHPFSGVDAKDMVCNNTSWTNILYDLTQTIIDFPEPPTHEPRK